jgi:hypothetical protein
MTFYYQPGLGNVASYQASGKPFCSGGINTSNQPNNTPLEISFPSVTRWFFIQNHDTNVNNSVKVGVSVAGLAGNNYFEIIGDRSDFCSPKTPRLELKVTKLYVTGASSNFDIVAGLTGIPSSSIPNNWSGIEGVG